MKTFQDYIEIYDGDRYCLMCRHVCPVTRMTKREATSPHGWALIVASVNRGLLKWDSDTVDTLYQCANCGTCEAHCATDRPLPAAIIAARAEVVKQGCAPAGLADLDRKLKDSGNAYGGADGRAKATVNGTRSSLGLYVGDAAFVRPQMIDAAVKLLTAAGRTPTLLGIGRSSGYLPYALGLWDTAADLARQTMAEIESGVMTQIVALSLEDAFALRDVYDQLGLTIPREVRLVDLDEFLVEQVQKGRLEFRTGDLRNYAYHDPCHTTRFPQHSAAARRLIGQTLGAAPKELFWREIRTTPCGASGGLQFTQPGLSEQLARAVMDDARQTGAELLLVDDAQCAAQLDKFSDGMPIRNLIEVLADLVEA